MLLALVLLDALFDRVETKFDELAFGRDSKGVLAEVDGTPVHVEHLDDIPALIAGSRARAAKHQVLWLGNSQLPTINQYQPGQMSAPGVLFERMRLRGVDVLTVSFPNASLQEHYVAFEYMRQRLGRLRVLLLPVVFDDFRETGIRTELVRAVKDPAVTKALEVSDIGRHLVAEADKAGADNEQDADLGALRNTVQERSERALNGWLDKYWTLWRLRREARGRLLVSLYRLRNTLIGIDAQSERPLVKARYEANMAALRALVASAKGAGVGVFLYIVPLRDDVKQPYISSEYDRFREAIQAFAQSEDVRFRNLEALVPARFWGQKNTTSLNGTKELDFMHFQAGGHELLAGVMEDELTTTFGDVLR